MIKVSFIIPMFNASKTLDRLLISLSHQGLGNNEIEAIFVDDSSTDGSAEYLENLKGKFPFIKLHRGKQLGPGGGRNIGMQFALGKYLWFVDADDYLGEGAALRLFKIMEQNDLDLLEFDFYNDYQNPIAPQADFFRHDINQGPVLSGFDYMCKYGYRKTVTTAMMNNSFVQKQKMYFVLNRGHEDAIYMPKLMSYASRVAYYPCAAYAYVRTAGTLSSPKTLQQYQKYVADSMQALDSLNDLKKDFISRGAPDKIIQHLLVHRETITFFMMYKMRFIPTSFKALLEFHRELKRKEFLPLRYFGVLDYRNLKFKFLRCVSNQQLFYALCIKFFHLRAKI